MAVSCALRRGSCPSAILPSSGERQVSGCRHEKILFRYSMWRCRTREGNQVPSGDHDGHMSSTVTSLLRLFGPRHPFIAQICQVPQHDCWCAMKVIIVLSGDQAGLRFLCSLIKSASQFRPIDCHDLPSCCQATLTCSAKAILVPSATRPVRVLKIGGDVHVGRTVQRDQKYRTGW